MGPSFMSSKLLRKNNHQQGLHYSICAKWVMFNLQDGNSSEAEADA
jgi:hypothetical protein